MADFAPQRVGHPQRSVVTVADLLGQTSPVPRIPAQRGPVSVSSLIEREGYRCDLAVRPVQARASRAFAGLDGPRRKAAAGVGAIFAVTSLAGAAILLSGAASGTKSAEALDGGYPGMEDGLQSFGGPTEVLGLPLSPVAASSPLNPGYGSAGVTNPVLNGLLPGPLSTGLTALPNRGGAVGGLLTGVVGGGGGLVGGTVHDLGHALGPLGAPVEALGDVLSHTTGALGATSDHLVGAVGGVVTDTTDSLGLPAGGRLVSGLVGGSHGATSGLLGGGSTPRHAARDSGPALSGLTARDSGGGLGSLLGGVESSRNRVTTSSGGKSDHGDLLPSVTTRQSNSSRHGLDEGPLPSLTRTLGLSGGKHAAGGQHATTRQRSSGGKHSDNGRTSASGGHKSSSGGGKHSKGGGGLSLSGLLG